MKKVLKTYCNNRESKGGICMGINYGIHKRAGFSDPSPYPEIRVEAPNQAYLEMIMDDYAGIVSEFTAINQYLYHYFETKKYDDLSEMFESIAINEMLHMEILSKLINLLGGRPFFRGGASTRGNDWSPRFVYYGCNICDMLHADLNSEFKAIKNYQEHIRLIDDKYIKKILERIILDERVHVEHYKNAIDNYCLS